MPTLRAFQAKHGDSLLLLDRSAKILIDGGPSGVYRRTLKKGLAALGPAVDGPPRLDLLMVSHIDADHIDGVLDLTDELQEARAAQKDPIVEVDEAWHNSFADAVAGITIGQGAARPSAVKTAASVSDAFRTLIGPQRDLHTSGLVLSSVAQGRRLRLDLEALKIDLNKGFANQLILKDSAQKAWRRDDLELRVVGPTHDELEALRKDWAKELPQILGKESKASAAAAAKLDTSVSNLASLVVIAETGGKRVLLTGDARGDMIMEWLQATGDLEPGSGAHFDIVKLPHHGSDRNVSAEFFERITADHYVISGNGGHGNPEPAMFDLLFTARPELNYTVHMTYGPHELKKHRSFEKAGNGPKLDAVLTPERLAVLRFPAHGETHLDVEF